MRSLLDFFSVFLKAFCLVLSSLFNLDNSSCCIDNSFFQDEIIKIRLSISSEISSDGNAFMMSKVETSFF